MKLLIGTTNKAKIDQVKGALSPLGLEIIGIPTNRELPQIEEDGTTSQENAKKKAIVYSNFFNETVLSLDSSLFFDGLDSENQPGVHTRRINKKDRATDKETLEYYSNLIGKLGNLIHGEWRFGISICNPSGKIFETTIISPRIFTNIVSPKMIEGFPLESLQIDPETNKYISEMTQEEQDFFWQKTIGKELQEFVRKSLSI